MLQSQSEAVVGSSTPICWVWGLRHGGSTSRCGHDYVPDSYSLHSSDGDDESSEQDYYGMATNGVSD